MDVGLLVVIPALAFAFLAVANWLGGRERPASLDVALQRLPDRAALPPELRTAPTFREEGSGDHARRIPMVRVEARRVVRPGIVLERLVPAADGVHGVQDDLVGDPAFDRVVRVVLSDPAALAALTPAFREAFVRCPIGTRLSGGTAAIIVEEDQGPATASVLGRLVELAEAEASASDPTTLLARAATTDPEPGFRARALEALASLAPERGRSVAVDRLGCVGPERRAAARVLGRPGPLIEALADPKVGWYEKVRCARTLTALDDADALTAAVGVLRDASSRPWAALLSGGVPRQALLALPPLATLSEDARSVAIGALARGTSPDAAVEARLLEALGVVLDPGAKVNALVGLCRVGTATALAAVRPLLDHPSEAVRRQAEITTRALRARSGVSGGELGLAEGEVGGLSEAGAARGALAQATRG
ncbi:MAG: hypothetical protein H6735_26365 [Alphaproteobacteria bacterium]|nr:hypothetical protein [Alphaproteobacteria bacterium]